MRIYIKIVAAMLLVLLSQTSLADDPARIVGMAKYGTGRGILALDNGQIFEVSFFAIVKSSHGDVMRKWHIGDLVKVEYVGGLSSAVVGNGWEIRNVMRRQKIYGNELPSIAPRTSFPECNGMQEAACVSLIKRLNPDLRPVIMGPRQPLTRDFQSDRVRILVGDDGIVRGVPSVH